ncbi:MAG: DNA mismatch repair endonuclease MutL [Fimbriimonadaceae bacterium]|jgi:DNA mismatch repair protein MutL|nr:DNA mismatch repair endonuclease MutL [Fimbriimonadaceae bacterium]
MSIALTSPIGFPSDRPTVQLLDPHTVNQIAAGEVVERPAAALKELVENALDAKATVVEIDLLESGRKLIQVSDNGLGMDRETAHLALLRHATSKIRSVHDLNSVLSLGFRGEALPSIASVSALTLSSGPADGARSVIEIEAGEILSERAESGPRGTTVVVRDLFLNTPARLKFLKSDATELSACVEVVSKLALATPWVVFRLRHGKTTLVQTSGSGDLATTVGEIWGREVAKALVPLDHTVSGIRILGLVSPPHFTKPTRAQQWFFVNGRIVKNRSLMAALDQAYRSLTPEKRFPLAVLVVEIDPARLDVNVSPTKSEVKFHQEGLLFDAVRRGVKGALLASGMVPTLEAVQVADEALRQGRGTPPFGLESVAGSGPSSAGGGSLGFSAFDPGAFGMAVGRPSGHIGLWAPLDLPPGQGDRGSRPFEGGSLGTGEFGAEARVGQDGGRAWEGQSQKEKFLDGLRVLGQVDQTFIIAENRSGLLVIDQHVAHERILYEMLVATRGSGAVEVQHLLVPETLHVDRRAGELLMERLEDLAAVGFVLEPFGGDSFLVRGLPAVSRGRPPREVLRDLVDEIADGARGDLVATRDDVYIMASCKMAIKAGDRLGMPEMVKLLEDLATTENPYLCPHGRPITLVLPKGDLFRKFKR